MTNDLRKALEALDDKNAEEVEFYFGDTLDRLLNGIGGARVHDIDGHKYLIKRLPDTKPKT